MNPEIELLKDLSKFFHNEIIDWYLQLDFEDRYRITPKQWQAVSWAIDIQDKLDCYQCQWIMPFKIVQFE